MMVDQQALEKSLRVFFTLSAAGLIMMGAANAGRLEVADDAPAWAHIGAAILQWGHIGAGTLGLLMGTLALLAKKGSGLHISVGRVFVAAMFVTYLIGAGVAPFLDEGQRPNFVGGVVALFLLITGWRSARVGEIRAGRANVFGLLFSLIIVATGAVFFHMGQNSPTGTIDNAPPQAFILFMVAGSFAALGEFNVLIRRQLGAAARVARHLWRMCFAFFIGTGSAFLGQMQFFSDWFLATPLPYIFALAPLVALPIWMVIVRLFWRDKAFS